MGKIKVNGNWYSSIKEAAKSFGIPYTTVLHRLDAGMSIEESLLSELKSQRKVKVNNVEYKSIADAARACNISYRKFSSRIRNGWTPEEAAGIVTRNVVHKPRKTSPIVISGKAYPSVTQAAKELGFNYSCVSKRLEKGMTPEQAFEIEPFPEWFIAGKGQFAAARKNERERQEKITNKRKCSSCKNILPLSEFSKFYRSKSHSYYYNCKNCQSDRYLRYRYGISVNEYAKLIDRQGNKCAICSKDLNLKKNTAKRSLDVAVDHCHSSGKVRGLLCASCNQGLGLFKDSIATLENAINYLVFHYQATD